MGMLRLNQALTEEDREHVRRIVQGTISMKAQDVLRRSAVQKFLAEQTFIVDTFLAPFRKLAPADRERVISELIWRITCHVDGSITRVPGVRSFDMGSGVFAVLSEDAGGVERVCLTAGTAQGEGR